MSMRYIFFLAIALIFFSCETDWGKYGGYAMDYDSALEYYIILDKGEVIHYSDSEIDKKRKGIFIKRYYKNQTVVDSLILG